MINCDFKHQFGVSQIYLEKKMRKIRLCKLQQTEEANVKLFSGLKGRSSSAALDAGTAVMIPMVAAMLADGSIDDDEISQIRSICLLSPIFAHNTRDRDTEIIIKAIRLIEDDGSQTMCEKAAQALSPALRETAVAFAIMMVMSDGHIGRKEEELIDNVIKWMAVDGDRAEMIAEVCTMLRNGPES